MKISHTLAALTLAAALGTGCSQTEYSYQDLNQLGLEETGANGEYLNGPAINGFSRNGFSRNGFSRNGISLIGSFIAGNLIASNDDLGVYFNSADLVNTEIDAVLEDNVSIVKTKINKVTWNADIQGYLYEVKQWDGSAWVDTCGKDSNGDPIPSVALSDVWSLMNGSRIYNTSLFTYACTNAALGKCVMWGYPRWLTKQECKSGAGCKQQDLAYWHEACQHMVRADYCGNGVAHTKNGTTIDVYDPLGIQTWASAPGFTLEAEWRHDGAHCIQHTRWTKAASNHPYATDLQYIQNVCPSRLAVNNPAECSNLSNSTYFTNNGYSTSLEVRKALRNDSILQ